MNSKRRVVDLSLSSEMVGRVSVLFVAERTPKAEAGSVKDKKKKLL